MYSNAINASCQPESPEELLVCVDARFPQLFVFAQLVGRALRLTNFQARPKHKGTKQELAG